SMGGHAYTCLGREGQEDVYGPTVFRELAGRFVEFADLLAEVSESSRVSTNRSILALYERWIQTGSRRTATLLAERGVVPVARSARSVTQLELELQGEVDKYLNAVFLLSLQNEGAVSARLRELIFRRYRLAEHLSLEQAERYRTASHLAYRYCGWLEERFLRP